LSLANSSSKAGFSNFLIPVTFTLNTAGFPAKSSLKYSAGKETLTSPSCPTAYPTNCSSKVSINDLLPNCNAYPSAFPPSNGTPSMNPSKSKVIVSSF